MNMEIRQAKKQELYRIKELLSGNDLPVSDIDGNSLLFFVAITDNRITGTIGIEQYNAVGLLRSLAVMSENRNRKVGESLIRYLFDYCRSENIKKLYLLTTTAENYFHKFGFQKIGRNLVPSEIKQTSEFRDICPGTAVIMYKENISGIYI